MWRIDFKYNEELTQVFMSSNQINGFFTRLEASRKYVMGTAGVFGEANNSLISGVVVLRGQDWKPVLSVAPDIESYDVSPLDPKKPEDKKLFEDMLAWEAEIGGKKWADGKSELLHIPCSNLHTCFILTVLLALLREFTVLK